MYKHFFKRFFDIVFSFVALIIFSPLLLILAICVKIDFGGRVFFCQYRPGKNNKLFKIIKFRSMTNDVDENDSLLPDKERTTRFGRFLRMTCLDELPQLINILIGDMSFVGPRPRLVKDMVFYTKEQNHRSAVRPGLTGYDQAFGKYIVDWDNIFKNDEYYINHLSFWLDLKIIFKTPFKILAKLTKKKEIEKQKLNADLYYYGEHLLETKKITKEEFNEKLDLVKDIIVNKKTD